MKFAKWVLNWPRSLRIAVKILLMILCCTLLCAVPFFARDALVNSISIRAGALAGMGAATVANEIFFGLHRLFAAFLVTMLVINLLFFIIDECLNDTVAWRRKLQIILNILLALAGAVALWIFSAKTLPDMVWWDDILLSAALLTKMLWVPQLTFLLCAAIQMIVDIWLFGPQNRDPWILRSLRRSVWK